MPAALAEMSKMTAAESAWQYWSAFGRSVQKLHDWHTSATTAIEGQGSSRRLGLCFIEGHADLTQAVWPSQAGRSDVLVSHVGPKGTLGLVPGDRLVAIDGKHPIDWVAGLVGTGFGGTWLPIPESTRSWSSRCGSDPALCPELQRDPLRSAVDDVPERRRDAEHRGHRDGRAGPRLRQPTQLSPGQPARAVPGSDQQLSLRRFSPGARRCSRVLRLTRSSA